VECPHTLKALYPTNLPDSHPVKNNTVRNINFWKSDINFNL
jgi:hypothetical protein